MNLKKDLTTEKNYATLIIFIKFALTMINNVKTKAAIYQTKSQRLKVSIRMKNIESYDL